MSCSLSPRSWVEAARYTSKWLPRSRPNVARAGSSRSRKSDAERLPAWASRGQGCERLSHSIAKATYRRPKSISVLIATRSLARVNAHLIEGRARHRKSATRWEGSDDPERIAREPGDRLDRKQ